MARTEARALGGYYAYPDALIPATARLITVRGCHRLTVVDPCAGEGKAVMALINQWAPPRQQGYQPNAVVYTCELERERAKKLQEAMHGRMYAHALYGDAFRVQYRTGEYGRNVGADILYLNPPYDVLKGGQRLEAVYLERFTGVLRPGGVLMFVVPIYTLPAYAEHLARHYERVGWAKLPEPEFQDYKQVVLVATKASAPVAPELDVSTTPAYRMLMGAPEAVDRTPVIGRCGSLAVVEPHERSGIEGWSMGQVNLHAMLAEGKLGMQSGKRDVPSQFLGLQLTLTDLIGAPTNPVLLPPRPGHIAQALSMGLFNGVPVEPDDPTSGLPTVLVKGVFTRERVAVSERTTKDGEVKGVVEVEQPQLRLTALDTSTGSVVSIAAGIEPTGATDLAAMNAADLLVHYGRSLGAVLIQQCPALHTPGIDPDVPLPPSPRTPFTAQRTAISAALKAVTVLGENPPILGEVGVGKTTIALLTAEALSPRHRDRTFAATGGTHRPRPVENVLVMVPPHLLSTWAEEVNRVVPDARVVVLEGGRQIMPRDPERLTVYVLSRETAKLGHGHAGVGSTCPRCGAPHGMRAKDLVEKRATCTRRPLLATNRLGKLTLQIATLAAGYGKVVSDELVPPRVLAHIRRDGAEPRPWEEAPAALLRLIGELRELIVRRGKMDDTQAGAVRVLVRLILAIPDEATRVPLIREAMGLYECGGEKGSSYNVGAIRELLRVLALTVQDDDEYESIIALIDSKLDLETYQTGSDSHLAGRMVNARKMMKGIATGQWNALPVRLNTDGSVVVNTAAGYGYSPSELVGDAEMLAGALRELMTLGGLGRGPECGERLYQATPEPRRYPLAKTILRQHPDAFDLLILDEAHEYANDGSAQERAAHRLVELGVPVLWMSGSISDGFASGLFANLWAMGRAFRTEWGRDGVAAWTRRYGYRKLYREFSDDGTERTDWMERRFGAVSDRNLDAGGVTRVLGESPGVMPHAILGHILPSAVIIHKSDLDVDLPPMTEGPDELNRIEVADDDEAGQKLLQAEATLRSRLVDQISKDRFEPGMAGRLFGALGQVPTYLDRATTDCGNGGVDAWQAHYPESAGGGLVATAPLFDAGELLPKERWLLARVEAELAEGRNVLIGVLNTGKGVGLVERLMRIIGELTPCAYLDSGKVATAKRKDWIDGQVVGKGRRVLFVNPMAVQTGLNNLVHFSTLVLYQTPPGAAKLYRQVVGRVHRPGQKLPVRVLMPYYAGTTQALAVEHLARKVSASLQVDGLDIRSALESAGAGVADAIDVLGLGEAIYRQLVSGKLPTRRPAPSLEVREKLVLPPRQIEAAPKQLALFDDVA